NFGYRLCEDEATRRACQQADILACGQLLYQLVTGQPAASEGSIVAPAELKPGMPVDVEEIILDALAPDPADRPASMAALAALLREVADTLGDRLMSGGELLEGEPVIRVRATGEADRLIRLNRDTFYIGQERRNDLLLPGHGVAPVHARLDRGPAGWEISDLGSKGGTRLSDARLLPNLPEPWLPSQTLFIGPYQLNLTTATPQELAAEIVVEAPIGVALLPQAARVLPGERVDFQLSLVNQGNQVDHVSLAVAGVPDHWVTVSETQLELMPGARGYLLVTVAPPRQSEATAGEYALALNLQSAAARGQCASVTGLLTVGEFDQLLLDLHPEHLINDGVSRLQVINQGNRPVTLELIGRDSEEALLFTVDEREDWRLPAGESTTIAVNIRAQQRPFFGSQQRIPFELLLDANEGRHFQNGQLLLTPRLPSWVLAAAGMSVAFICLVFGFIGNILLSNRPVVLAAEIQATATALQQLPVETATADPLGSAAFNSGLPQSCRQIRQQNGSANAPDGEYTLYVAGDVDRPVAVYCHDMARSAREYITLDTATSGGNFSTISYPDQQLRTTYLKVRLDLQTLRIDPTDRTFALVEGSLPSFEEEIINDFGSAIGCSEIAPSGVFGEANINLVGTPFVLAETAAFTFAGPEVDGAATLSEDRATATITVTGNCGWAVPHDQIPLAYVGAR
ncbi:MAG: FHA domain-containing protein, partial [Anaerolineales bacterium]|nr:FHA domain-containing protein [Anaerolineales bacterium]